MNTDLFEFTHFDGSYRGMFRKDNYGGLPSGPLCITILTQNEEHPDRYEEFTRLSVNLISVSPTLPAGAWYGKHWSENEGLLQELEKLGLITELVWPKASSGHVDGIAAYKLTELGEKHAFDGRWPMTPESPMDELARIGQVMTIGAVLGHKAQQPAVDVGEPPMDSYQYAEHLQEMAPTMPPLLVVYGIDDEGNEFRPVENEPTFGYYENGTFTPADDTPESKAKINAICVN